MRSVVTTALSVLLLAGCTAAPDPGASPVAASPAAEVPGLLWTTPAQARDLLREQGLTARFVPDERCDVPPERVTGSAPATGGPAPDDGVVRVRVATSPPAAFCAYGVEGRLATRLLDLARTGTGGPRFADEVEVHVDGRLVRTLDRADARDPELWGDPSPLAWLVEEAARPAAVEVAAQALPADRRTCDLDQLTQALCDRPSVRVQVLPDVPETVGWYSCAGVRLYRERGRVDAVALTCSVESVADLFVD